MVSSSSVYSTHQSYPLLRPRINYGWLKGLFVLINNILMIRCTDCPAPPLPSRCLHPINNCPLVTIDHLHTEQYTGLVAGRGVVTQLQLYKWKHTKLNLFLSQMCSGGGWWMEEPNLVFTAWCTNKLFVNVYKIYISLVWKTHTRVLFSQKSGLNINL